MAVGEQISFSNFPQTTLNLSDRIYGESRYYYIRCESFSTKFRVYSSILDDWIGDIYVSYYDGIQWVQKYTHVLRDIASANDVSARFSHNIRSEFYCDSAQNNWDERSKYNLWRIALVREAWGTRNGLGCEFRIGSCGTMDEEDYDTYLKGKLLYSNGRTGEDQTTANCAAIVSSTEVPLETVLNTLQSNRGTQIYYTHARTVVGALRY